VARSIEHLSPVSSEASDFNTLKTRFAQANIDEGSGKREEALKICRSLDKELKERKNSVRAFRSVFTMRCSH